MLTEMSKLLSLNMYRYLDMIYTINHNLVNLALKEKDDLNKRFDNFTI